MKLTNPFKYSPLQRTEGKNGRRYIVGESSPLPSVTTILSKTKDMTPIFDWQNRVGKEEADKVVKEASNIGTSLHENLENYILHGTPPTGTLMSKILTKLVIEKALCNVDEVWGTEVALYAKGLYAGTTDLVGVHKGTPAIMDFKNSLKPKKKEWITDYFMQLTAYGLSHDEMFGTAIKKGVVMIACRTGVYQEYIIEGEEWDHYQTMWCEKVVEYYDKYSLE